MKPTQWTTILLIVGLAGFESGCSVITAPTRLFGHRAKPSSQTAAANSDVTNPGHPVASPTPKPQVARNSAKTAKAKPSPSPAAGATIVQFPVAKPVPGRSGLVFNPFNPHGAYIDVSGYASGSKVKDPDSQKIFVVP